MSEEVVKKPEIQDREKNVKKELPAWLVLGIITIIAALCLAVVYGITKEPIRVQNEAATEKTIKSLMLQDGQETDGFKKKDLKPETAAEYGLDALYVCFINDSVIGYVGQKTVNGFGGKVQITVGISADQNTGEADKITGISVGGSDFSETAGLGAKAKGTTERGGDSAVFVNRFAGKNTDKELAVRKGADPKNDYTVDAITAATITSKSVTDGVNEIVSAIKSYIKDNATKGGAVN